MYLIILTIATKDDNVATSLQTGDQTGAKSLSYSKLEYILIKCL